MAAHAHYMERVFAPMEALNREIVRQQTFGHLYPETGVKHYGTLLFCETEYGECVLIKTTFPTLSGGPWEYDDFNEWLGNYCTKHNPDGGAILEFGGYYKRFKNGNYTMVGKVRQVM
jgi:hypothetical protein